MKAAAYLLATLVLALGLATAAYAQPAAIDQGLSYLRAAQAADGSWGGTPTSLNGVVSTTAVVARTFQLLGVSDATLANALPFIAGQTAATVEELGLQAEVLAVSGTDVAALVASLRAAQRGDGGWGLDVDKTFPSEAADTLAATRALNVAAALDTATASRALGYLVSQQNADGGWGTVKNQPSQVFYTALALLIIRDFQNVFDVGAPLNAGARYLAAQQNTDGSFGGSVFETALAFEALVRVSLDTAGRAAAVAYLMSAQAADGSWAHDAFSTALALRALKDAATLAAAQIQAITLALVSSGGRVPTTAFNAFQTAAITVTTGSPTVAVNVAVRDGTGAVLPTRRQGSEFFFDTQARSPGTFTVVALALDASTGILVDERTATFTIETTVAVADTVAVATPAFTHVGATETVAVSVSLTNRSNVPATLSIQHTVTSPSGTVLSSGVTSVPLPVNSGLTNIALAAFSHRVTQSGQYTVQVRVLAGPTLLTAADAAIVAAPLVHIDGTQSLTPSSVTPDQDRRLRLNIRLRGVESQP
jgi:Prenyltransferase and squalene oxidase repeat